MNIPEVYSCQAVACAYNQGGHCHAFAITVGDGEIAHCDTYCPMTLEGGEPGVHGGVGACKVAGCRHNHHLTCHADAVEVGFQDGEIQCRTYAI